MAQAVATSSPQSPANLISQLLLPPQNGFLPSSPARVNLKLAIQHLSRSEFDSLLTLAQSNHVVVRGLEAFLNVAGEVRDAERTEWAEAALANERARIKNALAFLHAVCIAFEERECDVTVIKSLDHWPDFGSDLDLYTNANERDVLRLMSERFNARLAPRSWGDRLARKWNFLIPGLPEPIEVHVGRLGQTGEQVSVASGVAKRSRAVLIEGTVFHVPSISDRLMISTLQRMYRHFFFRLCDVLDTASLADTNRIDYRKLCLLAQRADIWEGVATYLAIVSDYVESYRGVGLDLPSFVRASARFGGEQIHFRNGFLRVPIVPQSAKLYGSQLARLLSRGEVHNGARLSLLPWLATAALVGQKFTGSDKGIW